MTRDKLTEQQIKRAEALLRAAGFQITIDACGCCDSPWVRITHNGEDIVFDDDDSSRNAENVRMAMHDGT